MDSTNCEIISVGEFHAIRELNADGNIIERTAQNYRVLITTKTGKQYTTGFTVKRTADGDIHRIQPFSGWRIRPEQSEQIIRELLANQ